MIRLVPDNQPEPLGIDDARDAAKAAFTEARAAQITLVENLRLTGMLYSPSNVTYYRLKGMRTEALLQLERAQAVADALTRSIEAMEAAQ